MLFKGSGVAIVTPFKDNGEIDFPAYEGLVNYHLENQTDSIIVCGTTGEAATMDEDEKISLIRKTVELVDGKIPVIAGTGSNNTKQAVDFSKKVASLGVDGLLVVTPYYNKAGEDGLYEHFKLIAQASDLPIILYTVPSRTGTQLPLETLVRLAKIDNIVGLKDATGNINYSSHVIKALGEDFYLYSGNDDMILPMMSIGAKGVISVVANILAEETHLMCKYYLDKEIDKSRDLQLKYLDLIDALFSEVNPIPVKAALSLLGMIDNNLRLPLSKSTDKTLGLLKKNMTQVGLLK